MASMSEIPVEPIDPTSRLGSARRSSGRSRRVVSPRDGRGKCGTTCRVVVATFDNPPHGLMDSGIVAGLSGLVRPRGGRRRGRRGRADRGAPRALRRSLRRGRAARSARSGPIGRAGVSPIPRCGSPARCAAARIERALERACCRPRRARALPRDFLAMDRSGAVFVAALNGSAMGGGCELASGVRRPPDSERRLQGRPARDPVRLPARRRWHAAPGAAAGRRQGLRVVLDGGPLSPAKRRTLD